VEQLRIRRFSETIFDGFVKAAGGSRIDEDGSSDYLLNEALIELKLIEEEGLEKVTRQRKVASIFRANQPAVPTVVINPSRLDEISSRAYYNAVAGPIQVAVKKAASQLEATRLRKDHSLLRVLVVLNNGYTALSGEEFKRICLKCVHHDTRKIDWLVTGGVYYMSDGFDHFFVAGFDAIPVNIRAPFVSFPALETQWLEYLDATFAPTSWENDVKGGHLPVVDLQFEIEGVRYVKPAGDTPESTFWPGGCRPRDNSTGLTECPAVAIAFPNLAEGEWLKMKDILHDGWRLRDTHREWTSLMNEEAGKHTNPLKPFVPILVCVDGFIAHLSQSNSRPTFLELCEFASVQYQRRFAPIADAAADRNTIRLLPLQYIHLVVEEIGQDKANDFASIYYVCEVVGFERVEVIAENLKVFWEYGVCVAASHAVKLQVDTVLYTRNRISV
jgi:hypothetical protein